MLLAGLLMVSTGAAVSCLSPNLAPCVAAAWLVVMGYSLELVPLIIKMAAINRIMQASVQMRRIRVSKYSLYVSVATVMSIAGAFLTIWTAIDPRTRQRELELTEDTTDNGEIIVYADYFCSSVSNAWGYSAVVWQCILLVSGSVMAFQSRKVRQDFNESQILGVLIYSQFLFAVARLGTFFLDIGERASEGLRSLLISIDTIVSLTIYFLPKMVKAFSKEEARTSITWVPGDSISTVYASRSRQAGPTGSNSRSSVSGNDKMGQDRTASGTPDGESMSPDGLPLEDEERPCESSLLYKSKEEHTPGNQPA